LIGVGFPAAISTESQSARPSKSTHGLPRFQFVAAPWHHCITDGDSEMRNRQQLEFGPWLMLLSS
jgi:hypothetical protein